MSAAPGIAPLLRRHSLRWRLPLVVCGLVAILLVTFLWAAYARVEVTLTQAAGARAQAAANQVASLLDGQRSAEQARQIGADPLFRRFLEARTDASRDAARARLTELAGSGLRRVELWDAAGSRLLDVSSSVKTEPETVLPQASRPLVPGIHELRRAGDVVFSDTVIEIRDVAACIGFIVVRSTFVESPRGIFGRLVGQDAVVRIANKRGDVWTAFGRAVPAVPVEIARPGVAQYRTANGEARIGAVSHVRAAPWAVWVDFPLAVVIAPARLFLQQMIGVAFVFLAVGVVLVSVVSARLTRPLSDLSEAAAAIATGDYSRRVSGDRRDEIGRLGRTFNAMAGQVEEAQQRLEARVAERTARLEAANKDLESFSYSVSHDLRAPLRSIDGFSQALLEDYGERLDAKGQAHLQRVRAAAKRMGELIDDLLELSRVGRAELRRTSVNLSDIGRSVAAGLQSAEPDRRVEIDIQDGLFVDADRGLIQIVLENLIGNAWKFTSNVTPARIELGVTHADGNNRSTYCVKDNGAGFDMAYADKLFRPFQRLHGHAEFPGTGIGLATVHRIIDRHGGRVWAEGVVGGGATVYFTLPQPAPEARS